MDNLKAKQRKRNPVARDLFTPKYRAKVEKNRKKELKNNPPRAIRLEDQGF